MRQLLFKHLAKRNLKAISYALVPLAYSVTLKDNMKLVLYEINILMFSVRMR